MTVFLHNGRRMAGWAWGYGVWTFGLGVVLPLFLIFLPSLFWLTWRSNTHYTYGGLIKVMMGQWNEDMTTTERCIGLCTRGPCLSGF